MAADTSAQIDPWCIDTGEPLFPTVQDALDCETLSRVIYHAPANGVEGYYEWSRAPTASTSMVRSSMWWEMISEDNRHPTSHNEFYYVAEDTRMIGTSDVPEGFPLGVNLFAKPPVGDFLPPSPTLGGDSVALLPPGATSASTWWDDMGRPTLEQRVDLVTGLPLISTQDLEIPFGGATFRLNRTRSAKHPGGRPVDDGINGSQAWWDWAGEGWMLSENPLLVVDSAVPDLVGNRPKTSWLWLDAHHSIPFQLIESNDQYAAPPRFRARMDHNGNRLNGNTDEPTQFEVWLYDGALKYTFVVVPDLAPPNFVWDPSHPNTPSITNPPAAGTTTLHERPFSPDQVYGDASGGTTPPWHNPWSPRNNPGLGVPKIALCVKIEDRYGHTVDITYHDSTSTLQDENVGTGDCDECSEQSRRIGMIKSITLSTTDETSTITNWTLVYRHRLIWRGLDSLSMTPAGWTDPDAYREAFAEPVLDRIYVFEHDDNGNGITQAQIDSLADDLITLEESAEPLVSSDIDVPAPLDEFGQGPLAGISPTWSAVEPDLRFVLSYHYRLAEGSGDAYGPTLIKSRKVVINPQDSRRLEESKVFAYGYPLRYTANTSATNRTGRMLDIQWLDRIYTHEDVQRVFALEADNPGTLPAGFGLNDLALWWDPANGFDDLSLAMQDLLRSMASYRQTLGLYRNPQSGTWDYEMQWHHAPTDSGTFDGPSPHGLCVSPANAQSSYLSSLGPGVTARNDGYWSTVGTASFRDSTGDSRHYRFHRLLVMPDTVNSRFGYDDWTSLSGGSANLGFDFIPRADAQIITDNEARGFDYLHASMFVNPYYLRSYQQNESDDLVSVGDLTKPRWISIIDEFDTRESMESTDEIYEGPNLIKKGQLSRRVVEMNAFGYVLRDRTWTFTDDGYIMEGGGLGEEFVYLTVEDYLIKTSYPIPTWLSDGQGGISSDPEFRPLLDEIVMVEHRSVGWSVAAYGEMGTNLDEASNGIVRFIEYDLFGAQNTLEEVPVGSRFQRTAEGIKKGTYYDGTGFIRNAGGEPLLYTRQYFRDPQRPGDIVGDIAFSGESGATQLLSQMPDLDQAPNPGITMTRVLSAYDDGTGYDSELDRPLVARMVVAPPRQVRPGSEWFYPVEVELYDGSGQSTWTATGQLSHPVGDHAASDHHNLIVNPPSALTGNSSSYNSLTWTYYERNRHGMSEWTVLDTDANQHFNLHSHGGPRSTPPIDHGWQRFPTASVAQPSNFLTEFKYRSFQLSDTYYPNGLRWARRTYGHDLDQDGIDDLVYEFILNDLLAEVDSNNNATGLWAPTSPGEYKKYRGRNTYGTPEISRKVRFPGAHDIDHRDFAENLALAILASEDMSDPNRPPPPYELLAEVLFAVDANGRLQRANMMDYDPLGRPMAIGYTEVNDLGELYRERGIDGTIRTQIRNSLGQTLRRYTGTMDYDWFGNPNSQTGDNMVMKERVEYGEGVNDAWLPTVTYRYEYVPAWDSAGYDVHFNEPPSQDLDGIPTVTSYDWRMRPVMTQQFKHTSSAGETILSTSVTYLDHADRPIFEVLFGQGDPVLGTLNPAEFDEIEEFPEAEDFFALTLRPVSLMKNVYGPDGTLVERRTYDTSWNGTGALGYISEITLNGLGGQAVYSQVSGSAADVTRIDNLGRVGATASVVPGTITPTTDGYELTRTDNEHDEDGNITQVISWERVINNANPVLDETNAVRSRSVSWYDNKKRLIASANLGTEDDGNEYHNADPSLHYNYNKDLPPFYLPADGTLETSGLSPEAQLNIYVYGDGDPTTPATEDEEKMSFMVDPNGSVTQYEYTGTGQIWREIENVTALLETDRRCTQYEYRYGKIQQIIAYEAYPNPPPDNDGPDNKGDGFIDGVEYQQTIVAYDDAETGNGVDPNNTNGNYGALVVDETFSGMVSRDGSLIMAAHLPDPVTGATSSNLASDAFYRLRYYFDGKVAERIDAMDRSFRYFYDDLGRLERIEVGHYPNDPHIFSDYTSGYPSAPTVPADRVVSVEYAYDDRNQLRVVTAYGVDGSQNNHVIAENAYEYDERGNIEVEYQQYGATHTTSSPNVAYGWSYQPTLFTGGGTGLQVPEVLHPGYDRLSTITYPVPDQTHTARVLTFGYGVTNSDTDMMSWVDSIDSSIGTTNLASFEYTGNGRRIKTFTAGGKIEASIKTGNSVAIDALDSFGRVAANTYQRADTSILYRGSHTYDVSGNRLSSRLIQATATGTESGEHDRVNTYNTLNQLTSTKVGLATADPNGVWQVLSPDREDNWQLDVLGNWEGLRDSNGNLDEPGRKIVGDIDPENPSPGFWQWGPDSSPTPDTLEFTHVTDQRNQIDNYVQLLDDGGAAAPTTLYDAAGNLQEDGTFRYHYDAWNRLVQIDRLANGKMVRHYTYDGLGRLIKTTSPDNFTNRVEHHHYDGVRRIQTVVVSDLLSGGGAMSSGDPALQQMALDAEPSGESTEPDNTNLAFAGSQMSSSNQVFVVYREYVWGLGDRGIDECLLYTDEIDAEWWCLTDLTGDLVGVCDVYDPDPGNGTDTDMIARVCVQWTYDAYGGVMSADHLHAFSPAKIGHKGLFVERLDVSSPTAAQLVPFAHTIYHNRNRAYVPMLGRFLQLDPNQSASALIAASPFHGRGAGAIAVAFSLDGLFGDGANLYQYLGSSPWMRSDPTGLYAIATGPILGDIAAALTAQYSVNLENDVRWAMDWDAHDEAHTRGSNRWVLYTFADAAYRNAISLATAGISDLIELGQLGFDYIEENWVYSFGGAGRGLSNVVGRALRHGSNAHSAIILQKLVKRGMGLGVLPHNMRVNQQLTNPLTGKAVVVPGLGLKTGKPKPDYQSWKLEGNRMTIYVGEAVWSQSRKDAQRKLAHMKSALRKEFRGSSRQYGISVSIVTQLAD